ncbi:methyltransferase family protein [Shouchella shacheensis]|uniref:methyltransferase family protein n=1 Tax=Shouchella shacheensis TaxID=1649580 RepID=UPI00073FFE67|nr:isoprenylcysteine carboxylmethyltransferase family protein [Shouchella shacheensis]
MTLVDGVFVLLTIIWTLEFVVFRDRGKKEKDESYEKGKHESISFYFILVAIMLAIGVSILFRENQWAIIDVPWVPWLGTAIYAVGIFLRFWAIMKLQVFFTRNVHATDSMDLVSDGPYRRLRHPLYTALLLCVVGISLYLHTWGGLLISLALIVPALLMRIQIEEELLTAELEERYRKWKRQRWVLLPWIY